MLPTTRTYSLSRILILIAVLYTTAFTHAAADETQRDNAGEEPAGEAEIVVEAEAVEKVEAQPNFIRIHGEYGEDDEGRTVFNATGLSWGSLGLQLPGVIGSTAYPCARDGIPFVQAKGAIDPLTGHLFVTLNSPISGNPRVRLRLNLGIYDVETGDLVSTAAFYGHDPNETRRVFDYDFRFSSESKRVMLATATGASVLHAAEVKGDGKWVEDFGSYAFKPDLQKAVGLMIEDVLPLGSDLIVLVSLREKSGFDGGMYLGGFGAEKLTYHLVRLSKKKHKRPIVAQLGDTVPMPKFDIPKEDQRLPAVLNDFGSLKLGEDDKVIAEIWLGYRVDRYEANRDLTGVTKLGRGEKMNIPVLAALKALEPIVED